MLVIVHFLIIIFKGSVVLVGYHHMVLYNYLYVFVDVLYFICYFSCIYVKLLRFVVNVY